LHACALADELKINEIIIPNNPGLFSAMGLLFTDAKHTYVKSIRKKLFDIDYSDLEQVFQVLETQGSTVLTEEGFKTKSITHKRFVDLRYVGQGFELLIALEGIALQEKSCKNQILKRFNEKHQSIYGYILEEEEVEMVNIRINSIGLIKKPRLVKIAEGTTKPIDEAQLTTREVYFEEFKGFKQTPIFSREKLLAKNGLEGPAIIEQYDTTTVVPPNWKASVDSYGLIHIARK
jgi:N-methylhydantoinase A